jgi:hypothetical protein
MGLPKEIAWYCPHEEDLLAFLLVIPHLQKHVD